MLHLPRCHVSNLTCPIQKFSLLDVDSLGSGGEYTIQMGFGWTNGVALRVAANHGYLLVTSQCLPLVALSSSGAAGLKAFLPSIAQTSSRYPCDRAAQHASPSSRLLSWAEKRRCSSDMGPSTLIRRYCPTMPR